MRYHSSPSGRSGHDGFRTASSSRRRARSGSRTRTRACSPSRRSPTTRSARSGGVGLIIIGGTRDPSGTRCIRRSCSPACGTTSRSAGSPQVAEAVHRHGCKIVVPAAARRAARPRRCSRPIRPTTSTPTVAHGRAQPGAARGVPGRAGAQGARGARDRGDPRRLRVGRPARDRGRPRRRRVPHGARLPAVAVPLAALQPAAPTAGAASYENRLRFPVEAMRPYPPAIGRQTFLGYRDQLDLVLGRRPRARRTSSRSSPTSRSGCDVDYVDLSRGRAPLLHPHADGRTRTGWEREYTRAVKTVTDEAGVLVGRFTTSGGRPRTLLASGEPTRSCSPARCSPTPSGSTKARDGA